MVRDWCPASPTIGLPRPEPGLFAGSPNPYHSIPWHFSHHTSHTDVTQIMISINIMNSIDSTLAKRVQIRYVRNNSGDLESILYTSCLPQIVFDTIRSEYLALMIIILKNHLDPISSHRWFKILTLLNFSPSSIFLSFFTFLLCPRLLCSSHSRLLSLFTCVSVYIS